MDFAVSGAPSPFLDFSGSFVISVECLVAVVERPFCLLEMSPPSSETFLLVAAYVDDQSVTCRAMTSIILQHTLSEPSSLLSSPVPRSFAAAESMRSFFAPLESSSTLRVSSCLFSSSPSWVLPLNWTSSVSPLFSGVGFSAPSSSSSTGDLSSPSWVRASERSPAVSGWSWWASACDALGQRYQQVGSVMAIAPRAL